MSPRKHRAGSKTVTYRPVRIGNGTASSSEAASFGELDGWTYAWQSKWAETLSSPTKKSARVLAKMLAPLFIDNDPTVVPGLMIPIASARLFYGSIWIMLPGFDTSISALASNANVRCLRKELGLRLADLIERTYLPTLTVLHEHWLEKQHKEAIGKPTDPTHLPNLRVKLSDDDSDFKAWTRNSFQLIDPLPRPRARKDRLADRLETVMSELWQKRGISGALSSRATAYEESLVFAKYVIGSESMLEKLGQLAESAATLRKSRETLPACLIVGGAGSGKDKFAKLLRLFSRDPEKIKPGEASKGYYAGEVTTMNLAAVRPAPLTASIMTGIEVCADAVLAKDCESRPFETVWRMEGVLQRVRSKNSGAKRDKDAGPPTLVLDEFNSMDPDSQGVLLRFLDNSEIIPVGGMADLKHESTDCLIIGIMNEDPEDISREKSVAFLKQGEYLGKFVGDLLYEHFLKLRRLRPDVMYRMMRNGKFIIPDLRDRRDDIPLLFYFSVESELKSMPGVAKSSAMILHIPLEVLDRLTQLDLDWSGNVRQLQALAKIVAGRVATSEPDPAFSIRLSDVEDALQEVALVGRARGN